MNILLTSAGRRSYIVKYFKDAIGSAGKIFASNSEWSIAMAEADEAFITPLIYDKEYIPFLLKICKEKKISVILSLFDIDLLILAKNKELFRENGIRIILASEDFVRTCNDKFKTYQFLKQNNLNAPRTYLSYKETVLALERNEITFPIVIKPRWGMASLGIYYADNWDELRVLSEKSKKDVFNSYLKYESSSTPNNSILFQEKLSGKQYGLDILNDLKGNYIKTFAKEKVKMRAGETDIGLTVSSEQFEYISRTISEASRHEGILSVDCFVSDLGEISILEMNCRISGHYPLSHLAGFNYPKALLCMISNIPIPDCLLGFKTGLSITKDLVPTIIPKSPLEITNSIDDFGFIF